MTVVKMPRGDCISGPKGCVPPAVSPWVWPCLPVESVASLQGIWEPELFPKLGKLWVQGTVWGLQLLEECARMTPALTILWEAPGAGGVHSHMVPYLTEGHFQTLRKCSGEGGLQVLCLSLGEGKSPRAHAWPQWGRRLGRAEMEVVGD